MNLHEQSSGTNRREFFKKSLYSAPIVLALGHLAPSMVYGADSGFVETPQTTVSVAADGSNSTPDAGTGSGSGNTTNGNTGTSSNSSRGSSAGGAEASALPASEQADANLTE